MVNPLPLPADTKTDAKNRALRTFVQGLITDVIITVVGTIVIAIQSPDFVLSRPYLTALGLMIAKSIIMSAASYIMRFWKPPTTT